MLAACSLVNLTSWEAQSSHVLHALRLFYATPAALAAASEVDLHDLLRPLGLWRRRASSLLKLARHWVDRGPPADARTVLRYPGCGQYASDSWAIFVDGRTDVVPDDGKLTWYVEKLHGRSDGSGEALPARGCV